MYTPVIEVAHNPRGRNCIKALRHSGAELNQASEKLPRFKRPPVVEVVIGVQFAPLAAMHVGHLGLIWEQFKPKFPRFQPQMILPHAIERKGVHSPPLPALALLTATDQIHRVWMISKDESDLIQVQSDRFLRNWRRYHNDEIEYPSYGGHNRPGFVEDYENFTRFVADQELGPIAIDQCEMTYINHIKPCGVWSEFAQVNRVFKGWSADYPHLAGGPAGLIGCKTRHDVSDEKGEFIGHLYLELNSGFSLRRTVPDEGDPAPILQLQLTVRGRPLGAGSEGVMQFMDLAHRVIVKSFAEVTTPEMHNVWERIQ